MPCVGTCVYLLSESTGLRESVVITSKNDVHPDRVFIHVLHRALRVKPVVAFFGDGDEPHFNVEVARELFKGHLRVRTHDDIRSGLVNGLSCRLALFLPDALHGQTSKLNGLRRSGRCGTNSVVRVGCVPQVGKD